MVGPTSTWHLMGTRQLQHLGPRSEVWDTEVLVNACGPSDETSVMFSKDPQKPWAPTWIFECVADSRSVHLTHLDRTRPKSNPVDYTPLQDAR